MTQTDALSWRVLHFKRGSRGERKYRDRRESKKLSSNYGKADTVQNNSWPFLREVQADWASRLPARLPELCYTLNNVPVLHETLLFTYQGMFLLSWVNLLMTGENLETMYNFTWILHSWKTGTVKKLPPSPNAFLFQETAYYKRTALPHMTWIKLTDDPL